jgi:hypothetical protein
LEGQQVNYSIQLNNPKRKPVNMTVEQRASAWSALVAAFVAAHHGRSPESVSPLEVSLWTASRK